MCKFFLATWLYLGNVLPNLKSCSVMLGTFLANVVEKQAKKYEDLKIWFCSAQMATKYSMFGAQMATKYCMLKKQDLLGSKKTTANNYRR